MVWYGMVWQKWIHNTWERDKGKPETRVEMHCCTKVETVPKNAKTTQDSTQLPPENVSTFSWQPSPAPTTCQAECIALQGINANTLSTKIAKRTHCVETN